MVDASSNQGKYLPTLCLIDKDAKYQWLDASEGPYKGTGGLRLIGGGLSGSIPFALLRNNGLTISFWARNIQPGTVLLELADVLSVAVVDRPDDSNESVQTEIQMARPGVVASSSQSDSKTASHTVSYSNPLKDWLWFSLQVDTTLSAKLNVFSRRGELLGGATLPSEDHTCASVDSDSHVKLQMLVPASNKMASHAAAFVADTPTGTAFVSSSRAVADVSFILIHKAVVDNAEILQGEIGRYNIAL